MWNVRDGTVVRDLLTGITGVWQVVFEGRWVVAASNRNDTTVLDVWDFGLENDDDWVGEPPGGLYDEDIFSDDDDEEEDEGYSLLKAKHGVEEDEEQEQADVDAMDEDLVASSDTDSVAEIESDENGEGRGRRSEVDNADVEIPDASEGVDASRWAPQATVSVSSLTAAGPSASSSASRPQRPLATSRRRQHSPPPAAGGSSLGGTMRTVPPTNDETPTAPRRRQASHGHSTRRR